MGYEDALEDLVIGSINANTWSGAQDVLHWLGESIPPICCIQETRFSLGREESAHQWARVRSRNLALGSAVKTGEADLAWSSGVGIFSSFTVGANRAPEVPCKWRHRCIFRRFTVGPRCAILLGSIYGVTSIGVVDENLELLTFIAEYVGSQELPFVLAGDWNFNPEDLEKLSWLEAVQSVAVRGNVPTCGNNTYDFFVMSQTLDAFDCEVQTYEDSPCSPHAYVSLTL